MNRVLARPLRRVVEELRQKPLLAAGVLLIGLILFSQLLLELRDARLALQREYSALEGRRDRLLAMTERSVWADRAGQAAEVADALRPLAWSAASEGRAQAELLAWLQTAASEAGIESLEVQPVATLNSARWGGLQVSLRVAGLAEGQSLYRLLKRIAQHEQLLVLEQLQVRSRPRRRFELVCSAFFDLQPGAEAP
jgi:hypothetical protein